MTRRFTLILAMLLSFTLGAVAQQVASSPTTDITSGYYVLCVSSDNGNATASYLYSSDDNKVFYDAVGSEKKLAGSTIDESTAKYLFYVTKNSDGKINITLWSNHDLFWPDISKSSVVKWDPGKQDQFTMNSSKGEFTTTAKGNAFILSLTSHYWATIKDKTTNGYVVLNSENKVGYNDENNKVNDNEKAKVQFYAVSGTPVSLTYNFTYGGSTRQSETHVVFAGQSYPKFSYSFADYYINAKVPSGKVPATNPTLTKNIALSQATLPFETEKYYYLGTAGSDPVMLSNNDSKSVSYRSKAQAEVLNDIEKDLWYVTGNVFDGFQFINVSAGSNNPALATKGIDTEYSGTPEQDSKDHSRSSTAVLAFSKDTWTTDATKVWDVKKGTNGFIVYMHGGENYNRFWSYTSADGVKFDNADGTVKEFALYEPEFEFPLVAVGDASYNSVAFPFAAQLADETTKMYKGKIVDNVLDAVEITALPASPAGAVLVNGAKAAKAKFVAVKEVAALDNTDFIGTTSVKTQEELSNYLIFGGDASTGEVGFYSCSAKGLSANRAYLPKPTSNTKSLTIRIGGESTGIAIPTEINSASANAPVYDLSGRRVTSTIKGHLYIQNGRKFIAE